MVDEMAPGDEGPCSASLKAMLLRGCAMGAVRAHRAFRFACI